MKVNVFVYKSLRVCILSILILIGLSSLGFSQGMNHMDHKDKGCSCPHDSKSSQAPGGGAFELALQSYFQMENLLASDKIEGVEARAISIEQILTPHANAGYSDIINAAKGVRGKDLATLRSKFSPLGDAFISHLKNEKVGFEYYIFYCPMANKRWIQGDQVVRNPYYGKEMLSCGQIEMSCCSAD